ncbi:PREDICTED: E3 ubiquitin-protein ligase ATL23-like [Erythranthe guttata]|nr:PREDICTED: E3 ubiquitin-protein ligase ATL23-like [Erythranthe guttata]|eukprot:XP_012837894.1 PREDICTED: E3 ubiquitin-protein ligase ATL23-like [Erythranthe guttata]
MQDDLGEFLLYDLPLFVGILVIGTAVILLYIFWFAADSNFNRQLVNTLWMNRRRHNTGVSALDLEKLPKVTGKDLVFASDCAICLDKIESEQPARLIPGCNHGFHLGCADTWLSKNPNCPVCRAHIGPEFFNPPETNPC